MAEVFGTAAGILQVAEVGFNLATTLYKYASTVKGAKRDIDRIARDVTLTSKVLKRTHEQLKADQQAQLCTDDALVDLEDVLEGCREAFKEVDDSLNKSMKPPGGRSGISLTEKLKWPLKQDKLEVLRANLEKLKTTLLLMLSVFAYGSKIKQTQAAKSEIIANLSLEKLQIQNLIQAKDEATSRYEKMSAAFSKLETRINDSVKVVSQSPACSTAATTISMMAIPGSIPPVQVQEPKALSVRATVQSPVLNQLRLCASAVNKLTTTIEVATKRWETHLVLEYGQISNNLRETTDAIESLKWRAADPVLPSAMATHSGSGLLGSSGWRSRSLDCLYSSSSCAVDLPSEELLSATISGNAANTITSGKASVVDGALNPKGLSSESVSREEPTDVQQDLANPTSPQKVSLGHSAALAALRATEDSASESTQLDKRVHSADSDDAPGATPVMDTNIPVQAGGERYRSSLTGRVTLKGLDQRYATLMRWRNRLTDEGDLDDRDRPSHRQRDTRIRFNDRVEQRIAVEHIAFKSDEEEESEEELDDDDDAVMMKRKKGPSRKNVQSVLGGSTSSTNGKTMETLPLTRLNDRADSLDSTTNDTTVGLLPSTCLKYRADDLDLSEDAPYPFTGRSWRNGNLSPSPSQDTLRPIHPLSNFLIFDDDNEADEVDRDRTTNGSLTAPNEDEEDVVAVGLLGRVSDTFKTARDIAYVIWNVGWRNDASSLSRPSTNSLLLENEDEKVETEPIWTCGTGSSNTSSDESLPERRHPTSELDSPTRYSAPKPDLSWKFASGSPDPSFYHSPPDREATSSQSLNVDLECSTMSSEVFLGVGSNAIPNSRSNSASGAFSVNLPSECQTNETVELSPELTLPMPPEMISWADCYSETTIFPNLPPLCEGEMPREKKEFRFERKRQTIKNRKYKSGETIEDSEEHHDAVIRSTVATSDDFERHIDYREPIYQVEAPGNDFRSNNDPSEETLRLDLFPNLSSSTRSASEAMLPQDLSDLFGDMLEAGATALDEGGAHSGTAAKAIRGGANTPPLDMRLAERPVHRNDSAQDSSEDVPQLPANSLPRRSERGSPLRLETARTGAPFHQLAKLAEIASQQQVQQSQLDSRPSSQPLERSFSMGAETDDEDGEVKDINEFDEVDSLLRRWTKLPSPA